jgi:DNA-binding LacI/PurR family transcriptional regulator
MASMADVAKRANVSVATVSRAFNNDPSVTLATAKRVREVAKELGYVPRAVRPGRRPTERKGVNSGVICFLSVGAEDPGSLYTMPAMSEFMGGIQRAAARQGMELMLAHMPDKKSVPSVIARRHADGILIFGQEPMPASLRAVFSKPQDYFGNTPLIFCVRGAYDTENAFDHVVYDNSKVGRIAADYLIDRGCQQLAFACTEKNHTAYTPRHDQFLKRAGELGFSAAVVEGPHEFSAASRQKVADELIDQLGTVSHKTGIFCASDDLMMAVFNTMRQRGIEPGDLLELIGCNNDPFIMSQMHPRPATIDIKMGEIGERAVDQLFWRISHQDVKTRADLHIQPEVVAAEIPVVSP